MATAAPPAPLRSREEVNALFQENLYLANAVVNKYRRWAYDRGVDPDDLDQVARVALWRAAGLHEEGSGEIESYIFTAVKRAVVQHLQRHKIMRPLPADKDGNTLDPEAPELGDVRRRAVREELKPLLGVLDGLDRELIRRRFGIGERRPWPVGRLASLCGLSRQAVGARLSRALLRMREAAG